MLLARIVGTKDHGLVYGNNKCLLSYSFRGCKSKVSRVSELFFSDTSLLGLHVTVGLLYPDLVSLCADAGLQPNLSL